MSNSKSGNDYARTLGLLWGSHNAPGRRGLTIQKIVDAGIELADAHGIEQLSMRKVAERLEVGAMTLYTYVPGKSELLDLMLNATQAGLYPSEDIRAACGGDWKEAIRYIAKTNWDMYMKHPWITELSGRRPVLGPHIVLKYELELRALDGIGLTDIEMDSTLSLILMHVESCARMLKSMKVTADSSGIDDNEWWLEFSPALDKLTDWSRFPVSSRVGEASSIFYQSYFGPEHAYQFGLERIIAGTAALMER
ncbi:TetR/AcrR family transcriptional regulator [Paenibacillus soyae]|uniref:TetR/AcrR family transcriptional regulator n=1 Tax=Paenibacillus soyae TaxID=2969249 RepID=A0A9X2SAG0_9BACL|nr:TetR/AcrR family transcriptional regulator [Paenibacillus soyae]MCR2805985.1 TetR/AcrR family transcriptional regulator [Paenibacillus soyae]